MYLEKIRVGKRWQKLHADDIGNYVNIYTNKYYLAKKKNLEYVLLDENSYIELLNKYSRDTANANARAIGTVNNTRGTGYSSNFNTEIETKTSQVNTPLTMEQLCADNNHIYQNTIFYNNSSPDFRIVAIGDIHGDSKYMIKSLRTANVIDEKGRWIARNTLVVQTGDQIDRCRPVGDKCRSDTYDESDIKILDGFDFFRAKARKYGCEVISLMGNHELENVRGNKEFYKRYVTPAGIKHFGSLDNRKKAFAPGGTEAIRMACTRPLFLIVNGRYLFTHAGITDEIMTVFQGLKSKTAMQSFSLAFSRWMAGLSDKNPLAPANHMDEKLHPLWNREVSQAHSESSCKKVKIALDRLDIKAMIVGHTIQPGRIPTQACNGTVFKVDIGGSSAFGLQPPASVLQITNNEISTLIYKKSPVLLKRLR